MRDKTSTLNKFAGGKIYSDVQKRHFHRMNHTHYWVVIGIGMVTVMMVMMTMIMDIFSFVMTQTLEHVELG
jgi:5,10-methylene-tetrahydrofolate dehydrogenase/methenyl tetrahydrofolate cyclohydrolase